MNQFATLRIRPGTTVRLREIDPSSTDGAGDETSAREEQEKLGKRLGELQFLLYAECARSLLMVLQAMDAGGKDGTIKHVIASMNPQGVTVQPFKAPSAEELAHDYLWRAHKVTPALGRVAVFNRSHYEDVLVPRVHGLVPKEVWSRRYDEINAFEQHLFDNGTHIVKFFLHIDKQEQLRRFRQRLEDPARQWKISEADYTEREFWDGYRDAYEEAISRCSTEIAPWHIIPANHKWFRNLAVSRILVEKLESMDMHRPAPSVDIEKIKRRYHEAQEENR